ncbi:MAG: cyclic nucleotide-binding domain-containing protein [Betaproteobacteria bacterium]
MDPLSALSGIFPTLPRNSIRRLAEVSGMQRIGKGSLLFREGERADFVYALIEGRASLISGREHEETIADFMEAGDVFLVPPALLQLPYMVTAKAVTDLLVVLIPVEEFRRMAEAELALAVALNRLLAGHWRLLLRHLTQTKSRDADTRLVQFLIDGAGVTDGAARFTLPGSKQDLAAHLGMTPATLSRALKRLSPLGVKTAGSDVEIEDIARLSAFSGSQAAAYTQTGA